MKLFKKMLLGVMSFACLTLFADVPVTKNDRIIVISKQNYLYTPASPLDPNHNFMRSTCIFCEEEIAQLEIDAMQDFKEQYGIDMSVYPKNALGIRSNGLVTMLPGVFGNVPGQPWVVTTDTKHPEREFKWMQYQFPFLFSFSAPYVVTSGTQAGAQVKPGNLFFRAIFVQAKAGCDPTIPENREIFNTSCTILSTSSANMWGLNEFYFPYYITDKDGCTGFVTSATVEVKDPADATGVQRLQGRHVYTWTSCDDIDDCE